MLFLFFFGYRLVNAQPLDVTRNDRQELGSKPSEAQIDDNHNEIMIADKEGIPLEAKTTNTVGFQNPDSTKFPAIQKPFKKWSECRALDRNRDNRLGLREYLDASIEHPGQGRKYFTTLDKNADGFVDREEFRNVAEKK